jgi:hypothetical protein
MLIPELYRNFEKTRGRPLMEIGDAGIGFARADALEALGFLKGSQAGVSGGDVLKIVKEKPKYTYDSWHVDERAGESFAAYLERSIIETEKYIRNYPDPEDGTILYSMVVSELGL